MSFDKVNFVCLVIAEIKALNKFEMNDGKKVKIIAALDFIDPVVK